LTAAAPHVVNRTDDRCCVRVSYFLNFRQAAVEQVMATLHSAPRMKTP
jgi:hypothetical protein